MQFTKKLQQTSLVVRFLVNPHPFIYFVGNWHFVRYLYLVRVFTLFRLYITFLSRWYINAGAIFVWKNMAFYIKIWTFTYFAIKCHTFMADPLSCGAIKKCKKNCIDNIDWFLLYLKCAKTH